MVNFVLIVLCILAGMLLRRTRSIHPDAHKGINTWIIYVGLPAVSFKYIPQVVWTSQMIMPAAGSILVTLCSLLFVKYYCQYKGYSRRTRGSLELTTGYGNTSFIGFPLIAAYYGEQFISVGIISDQINFMLVSSVGIVSAVRGGAGQERLSGNFILRKLLTFPPFIGTVLAVVLSLMFDLSFSFTLFDKLAATVVPMALFSIGLQLKFNDWRKEISQISAALTYKLILAPAIVLAAVLITKPDISIAKVSVLEAAMPTLVSSSIIAEQFRLNTRLVNLIIGIGIIVGFLTTGLWYLTMEVIW